MIADVFAKVSNAQSVAGSGNLLSTDSYDQLAQRDPGAGRDLMMVFTIPTTIVMNATSTSLEFQVGVCDDDAGTNFTVIGRSPAILKAALTAGRNPVEVTLNQDYASIGRRFIKARYVANDAAAMTSGNVTAQLVPLSDSGDGGKLYPSGFPTP